MKQLLSDEKMEQGSKCTIGCIFNKPGSPSLSLSSNVTCIFFCVSFICMSPKRRTVFQVCLKYRQYCKKCVSFSEIEGSKLK